MRNVQRPHLLLVDHDDAARSRLQNTLAERYSVVTETPGESALDFICCGYADLALLNLDASPDIILDMIETVRDNRVLDTIPLLVIADASPPEAGNRCLTLGADAVLTRPFTTDALCHQIDTLLAPSADS